jgi:hypothetical protein
MPSPSSRKHAVLQAGDEAVVGGVAHAAVELEAERAAARGRRVDLVDDREDRREGEREAFGHVVLHVRLEVGRVRDAADQLPEEDHVDAVVLVEPEVLDRVVLAGDLGALDCCPSQSPFCGNGFESLFASMRPGWLPKPGAESPEAKPIPRPTESLSSSSLKLVLEHAAYCSIVSDWPCAGSSAEGWSRTDSCRPCPGS